LTLKIFLGTALVVVAILGVTLFVTSRSANRAADEAVDRVLAAGREGISVRLRANGASLAKSLGVFASNPNFRSLVESRRLNGVLDQSIVAQEELEVAWVQVIDAAGMRMVKSDEPGAD